MWPGRFILRSTIVIALLHGTLAHAQALRITPERAMGAGDVEALSESMQPMTAVIEGAGDRIVIRYDSEAPVLLYMVPITGSIDNPRFNSFDVLFTTLPEGNAKEAEVDLTTGGAWSPLSHKYLVTIFTPQGKEQPTVTRLDIVPNSFIHTLGALGRQFFDAEPYRISFYNSLYGYRVYGTSLTLIVGLLGVAAACAAFFLSSSERRLRNTLLACAVAVMIFDARFSLDLLRHTGTHLRQWYAEGTFAGAGSFTQVTDELKKIAEEGAAPKTYVCTSYWNYYGRMLRYSASPLTILLHANEGVSPTHVLVFNRFDWNFTDGALSCGEVTSEATFIREFPDGAKLFSLSQQ